MPRKTHSGQPQSRQPPPTGTASAHRGEWDRDPCFYETEKPGFRVGKSSMHNWKSGFSKENGDLNLKMQFNPGLVEE